MKDKINKFFKSAWFKKLLKICTYAVAEVLISTAFLTFVETQIPDQVIYGLVIVITVKTADALKALADASSFSGISKA